MRFINFRYWLSLIGGWLLIIGGIIGTVLSLITITPVALQFFVEMLIPSIVMFISINLIVGGALLVRD